MSWKAYFRNGKGKLDDMQIAAVICREFGWTYDEYLDQPITFIFTVMEMLNAEAEASQNRKKQQGKRPG